MQARGGAEEHAVRAITWNTRAPPEDGDVAEAQGGQGERHRRSAWRRRWPKARCITVAVRRIGGELQRDRARARLGEVG